MSESGMVSLSIFAMSPHTTLALLHARNVSQASALKSFAQIVLKPALSKPRSSPPAPQNRLTAVNTFLFLPIHHERGTRIPPTKPIRAFNVRISCGKDFTRAHPIHRRTPCPIHKKGAHFPFHALSGSPSKGLCEYMEKENAPHTGASPLTCRSQSKNLDVFPENDLLALMLNCLFQLRLGGGEAAVAGRPPYRFGHAGRVTLPSV